jgi:hypothetical protein
VADVPVSVLAFYWYFLRLPIYKLQLCRHFSKHSSKDTGITWNINDEGFKGGSEHSQSEFSWDSIGKMITSVKGFLVYQYPLFYWIPRHAFASLSESDRFEEMARLKVKEFVKTSDSFRPDSNSRSGEVQRPSLVL